jgi:hypothetical protein
MTDKEIKNMINKICYLDTNNIIEDLDSIYNTILTTNKDTEEVQEILSLIDELQNKIENL